MAGQAGLCLAWLETPEDTFCRVVAHTESLCIIAVNSLFSVACLSTFWNFKEWDNSWKSYIAAIFCMYIPFAGKTLLVWNLRVRLCVGIMFKCVISLWKTNVNYMEVDYNITWPCCKPISCIIWPKHLYFSNLGFLMPDLRVSAMKKNEIWPFWRNQEWGQIWTRVDKRLFWPPISENLKFLILCCWH